jgi:carbon monoxide dehydrogenase subunit G
MTTVTRTFTVVPAQSAVIDYLKDFGNAEQWDPGTVSCTRTDSGPLAVGATWHNVSKIVGVKAELTYTLEKLTADTIVLVGKNDRATSTDTITVRPSGDGCEITYQAHLEMHGAAKLIGPAMKLIFEKLGNDTQRRLTEVLNAL